MCSKKTLLIVSGLLSVVLIVWNYIGNYQICNFFITGGSAGNCPFILTDIGINLLPIVPIFLLSIITYKMRDEIYRAWLRFAQWWIPLAIVFIFLAPEYATDWMFPVTKGTVAFFSSILFVIISFVIIAWQYLSPRAKYKDDFKEGSRT